MILKDAVKYAAMRGPHELSCATCDSPGREVDLAVRYHLDGDCWVCKTCAMEIEFERDGTRIKRA